MSEVRDTSRIRFILQFAGVDSQQLASIHQLVASSGTKLSGRTATAPAVEQTMRILASQDDPGDIGTYEGKIKISTQFGGKMRDAEGRDRFVRIDPSRETLIAIFDALGILPEKEIVEG